MCREFATQDEDQRLVPAGRLPLPRAHAGHPRAAREERRRCRTTAGCRRACSRRTEARRIVPELDRRRRGRAATTPTTASSSPGPSCGATRRRRRSSASRSSPCHDVVGFDTTRRAHRRRAHPPLRPAGRRRDAARRTTTIRTHRVVNAAGAWSPEVARMLGVELPNKPHRHEICSTEPLKPWLKPLVADLSDGLYFSQSTRGEIVGGIGNEYVAARPRPAEQPRASSASTRGRSSAPAPSSAA